MSIIFTHAKWGQFELSLNAHPGLSITHWIAYEGTTSHARQVQDGLDIIRACTRVRASSLGPRTINRVMYDLTAQVDIQRAYTNVYWPSLTEKARAKLDDDPTLSDELLAFAAANLDALRQAALRDYQRRVLEVVKNIKDNADAIERAAMLPELND